MATRLYPIGIQTFEKIIEGGFVYVDKTEYVHQLANTSGSSFSQPSAQVWQVIAFVHDEKLFRRQTPTF